MEGLAVGRIVHYYESPVVNGGRRGNAQAAIITQVWSDAGTVNLTVFPDGSNDINGRRTDDAGQTSPVMAIWRTSIQHVSQVDPDGSSAFWDWPARA